MNLYLWPVMIFVTFLALMLGVGWLCEHGARQLERVLLLDQLDQATASVQLPPPLPRAGRLAHQGAQDPAYQLAPVPWELASAAYVLGQQRADQDAVSREVDAIMAEIEANPDQWRHR